MFLKHRFKSLKFIANLLRKIKEEPKMDSSPDLISSSITIQPLRQLPHHL